MVKTKNRLQHGAAFVLSHTALKHCKGQVCRDLINVENTSQYDLRVHDLDVHFANLLGQATGSVLGGFACDHYGRKKTFLACLVVFICSLVTTWIVVEQDPKMLNGDSPVLNFLAFVAAGSAGALYPTCGLLLSESVHCVSRRCFIVLLLVMQWLAQLLSATFSYTIVNLPHKELDEDMSFLSSIDLGWRALVLFPVLFALPTLCLAAFVIKEPKIHQHWVEDAHKNIGFFKNRNGLYGFVRRYCTIIFHVSIPWAMFDATFYGSGTTAFSLIPKVHKATIATSLFISWFSIAISGLGYFISWAYIFRKYPPKLIQVCSFATLSFIYFGLCISLLAPVDHKGGHHNISSNIADVLLYNGAYRFLDFAPNISTFIFALEVWPTLYRGSLFGMCCGIAKLGGFCGLVLFYVLQSQPNTLAFSCVASMISAIITMCTSPTYQSTSVAPDLLKKNFLKKNFGYEARCEFWLKLGC